MVDAAGRMVCAAESARRQRVRRGVAQGGDVRKEAERLRRLVCCGGVSDRKQVHAPGALRDSRPVQWRAVDGCFHDTKAGSFWRDLVRLSAAGYAAISDVR